MKTINLFFIFILLLQLSCKKNKSQNLQTTKYRVYDSVYEVVNNMNGGAVVQQNHYPLNRDIIINKNIITNELIYNSDTFVIYSNNPPSYSNKTGSFPILSFHNDSLSISTHIGGVGYQIWVYVSCVKY